MNQKQKLGRSQILFALIVLSIIIFCFMLLIPKVSSRIFPQKQEMIFNNFILDARKNNKIDPQSYWKFREFYSPGSFGFSKKGLDEKSANETLNEIGIIPDKIDYYFLQFNSRRLISLDGLTTMSKLTEVIDKRALEINEIIFENDNSIVYKDVDNQIFIITLYSLSDMQKANGFFDYNNKKDRDMIGKRNWINITKIIDS